MQTLEDKIYELLSNPQMVPDANWVMETLEQHPAFTLPAALLLARASAILDDDTRRALQARVMLSASDRIAMADAANLAQSAWSDFYPPVSDNRQKTTEETIDTFLSTYCQAAGNEDDELLEKLIFHPVAADYMQSVVSEEEKSVPESAMEETSAPAVGEPEEPQLPRDAKVEKGGETLSDAHEEPLLMESLAKIYIKQRRYERAFEIINNLSLKNPEKSAYFADQLRFLRKLIALQQAKAKHSGASNSNS